MCFWKSISSHTYAFLFLIFNALRCVFKNQVIFSKKMFFQIFDWSNLFFNQSKFCLKICVSFYLVRLIEPVFRSIEHRESGFLKMDFNFFKSNFFKSFFKFSLSPRFRLGSTSMFLSFLIFSFTRFLSPNTGKTLLPLPFVFIFTFHAFLIWEFRTMHKLGVLMIQAKSCVIDHWVLLLYCYIHDLCWKIWSIWRFVKNQNF